MLNDRAIIADAGSVRNMPIELLVMNVWLIYVASDLIFFVDFYDGLFSICITIEFVLENHTM